MPPDTASQAHQRLLATELSTADRATLAAAMRDARAVRGWVDTIDIACARGARELNAADGAESAEGMLIDNGRRSGREAKATGERETVCTNMPDLEAALASGAVSTDHIDAITNAARNLTDEERADLYAMGPMLAAEAAEAHAESFARTCRDMAALVHHQHHPGDDSAELDRQRAASKISRWVDRITGMHNTTISLDPLQDAQLWQLLDAEIARQKQRDGNSGTPFPLLQVQALFAALRNKHNTGTTTPTADTSTRTTDISADPSSVIETDAGSPDGTATPTNAATKPPDNPVWNTSNIAPSGDELCRTDNQPTPYSTPAVPEIYVHIDLATLLHGPHEATISELSNGTPLPVSSIRRLCCDANIIPVVLNGKGELLDVGRERRTANRAQRRALRALYRTCAHPHCTVAFDNCRIHHIVWWENGGRTDLQNLIPLCEGHHHQVHEDGWTITMATNRQATWHHPTGAKRTSKPDRRTLCPPIDGTSATARSAGVHDGDENNQPMLC